jgi:serine/threonine protein kinase/WD40 repeat protein
VADWNPRANDLFLRAAEIDAPTSRQAFLDQECGGDALLREQVERLLCVSGKVGSFLDRPAQVPDFEAATVAHTPIAEGPGSVIGAYKLLQKIGEGGMGVVYMAEQQEPVRRKVALKIIKPGMDSAQVIARFEAERQALALMDHQNIAKVFDGGTTASGRPYFVMELVHGVPITRYCDSKRLTPRERLALFVPVCQAIQHAHHKGVIHRDIKPSNVLVTMYDDKPVPKVIDFGVAKAIEQRLTERTLFTQFGALVGTFEYMSPEQAEMNAIGVDTRSDVYSLGVLLYELLTGTTPLEGSRLRQAAFDELVRLIKEEDPPRPSARLSSSDTLEEIAEARRTEPARLSRLVRGEIDWIVMKCLEKDRSRRYDTASGLAKDIERYLADQPVEACPPSATYLLRKLARRYKKPLLAAAVIVGLLVAGVAVSTWQAVRATQAEGEALEQRDRATAAEHQATLKRLETEKAREELRRSLYASDLRLTQVAWDSGNMMHVFDLLDKQRPRASDADLRGFEWHYWNRLCRKQVSVLSLTNAGLMDTLSPDGSRVASDTALGSGASKEICLRLWDAATGQELPSLTPFPGESPTNTATAWFSGDARRLACVGYFRGTKTEFRVKVLETDTGRELLTIGGQTPRYPFPVLDDKGDRLALLMGPPDGKSDWKAAVWDVSARKELRTITLSSGEPDRWYQLALSPDGTRLAVLTAAPLGGDQATGDVRVWDVGSGQEKFRVPIASSLYGALQFNPDGQLLAMAGDKDTSLKLVDASSGKLLMELTGLHRINPFVGFSRDGERLASTTDDGQVMIWDIVPGQAGGSRPPLRVLKGTGAMLRGVAFSRDGRQLRGISTDNQILTWDLTQPDRKLMFREDGGRLAETAACSTRFAAVWHLPENKAVIKVWDETGKLLFSTAQTTGTNRRTSALILSPDGSRLAYSFLESSFGEGKRRVLLRMSVWDIASGRELYGNEANDRSDFRAGSFSADGRRLAYSQSAEFDLTRDMDSRLIVWDLDARKELLAVDATGFAFLCLSPDGKRLAAGLTPSFLDNQKGDLLIWDVATGKELVSRKGLPGHIGEPVWSADGTRLALRVEAGGYSEMHIVAAESGQDLQAPFKVPQRQAQHALSPDGRRLISSSWVMWRQDRGEIKMWDAASGRELLHLPIRGNGAFAFSPDGRRLHCISGPRDGAEVELQTWDATPLPEGEGERGEPR